jgi:hypothetical protein
MKWDTVHEFRDVSLHLPQFYVLAKINQRFSSSRFGFTLTLVSIKLHFQVCLSVQSPFQNCDWNSEVSLALGTDCHGWHGANPLGYTQSALISSRHLQNVLQSAAAHHTVFS